MHLAIQCNSRAVSLEENVIEIKCCCISVSHLKRVYSSHREPNLVVKRVFIPGSPDQWVLGNGHVYNVHTDVGVH